MTTPRAGSRRWRSALAMTASSLAVLLLVSACNGSKTAGGSNEVTGSIAADSEASKEMKRATAKWSQKFAKNPADKSAAISLSRVLRAQGKKAQAVIIMRQSAVHHPKDDEVRAELGKALADAGRNEEALQELDKALASNARDWRTLSTYGTVLDQMQKHGQARGYYAKALKIAPNEPSVLSNMGLSYALDRNLPMAEKTLRQAAAQPGADRTVHENLALVLGLRGKFEEAEQVARTALPASAASGNVSYLKQMMSQPANWAKLKTLEEKNKPSRTN